MSSTTLLGGRYRLQDRIAVGGVGEVWRGVDTVLARPVAVKLLRAECAQSAETLARFRTEAQRAGSLSHPAIAQVYDYGHADPPDPPYLVMELVDGPSLAALLAAGPLGTSRTMDVIAQAAAGLHAAHTAGLVHRDIKPANLLLDPHWNVKITDFGIAYAAGSAPVTRTGLVVGTPGYLAPERAAGAHATAASDLYSLGVVAYECLTGHPPFTGTPLEVVAAHRDHPLPALPETIPAGVFGLVAELTAKDPLARPGSAGDVARRASRLRDRPTFRLPPAAGPTAGPAVGPAARLADDPAPDQAPLGDEPPPAAPAAPTTEMPVPLPPPSRLRRLLAVRRAGPRLSRRQTALAFAALAVVAMLVGLLAGGLFTGTAPTTRTSPSPSARLVEVNSGSLTGRPVSSVRQQLSRLGLVVRVLWRRTREQPAGTAMAVTEAAMAKAGNNGMAQRSRIRPSPPTAWPMTAQSWPDDRSAATASAAACGSAPKTSPPEVCASASTMSVVWSADPPSKRSRTQSRLRRLPPGM